MSITQKSRLVQQEVLDYCIGYFSVLVQGDSYERGQAPDFDPPG
jgi:hypothetical protein